jgi:hypothetical protein
MRVGCAEAVAADACVGVRAGGDVATVVGFAVATGGLVALGAAVALACARTVGEATGVALGTIVTAAL